MGSKNFTLLGVKILLGDDEPEVLALTRLMLIHYWTEVFTAPGAPTFMLIVRVSFLFLLIGMKTFW
jgi:hypothetical protein